MKLTKKYTWKELSERVANKSRWKSEKEKENFKKWFMTKEKADYCFDMKMIKFCYRVHKRLKQNKDMLIVNSGKEREGKTTLSFQEGAWISDNFNNQFITFTFHELIKKLQTAPHFSTVIIDEGGESLYSADSLNKANKFLIKALMICGMRNLCLIVNIPNFHMLNSYIRFHRVHALLQILKRGHYKGYLGTAINIIAKDGMRYKTIATHKVPEGTSWKGYFNKTIPLCINYEEYLKKKEKYVYDFLSKEIAGERQDLISATDFAKKIGKKPRFVRELIQRGKLKGTKIGNRYFMSKNECNKVISLGK